MRLTAVPGCVRVCVRAGPHPVLPTGPSHQPEIVYITNVGDNVREAALGLRVLAVDPGRAPQAPPPSPLYLPRLPRLPRLC